MAVESVGRKKFESLHSLGGGHFSSESGRVKLTPGPSTLLIATSTVTESISYSSINSTGARVNINHLRLGLDGRVLRTLSFWRDTHSPEVTTQHPLKALQVVNLAEKIISECQARERAEEEIRAEECRKAQVLIHTIPLIVITSQPRELAKVG